MNARYGLLFVAERLQKKPDPVHGARYPIHS